MDEMLEKLLLEPADGLRARKTQTEDSKRRGVARSVSSNGEDRENPADWTPAACLPNGGGIRSQETVCGQRNGSGNCHHQDTGDKMQKRR